ncbi:MAG: repair exonuclease [Hyphomicrobiales bacterium]|nr:repair exonuclease [Hyphomicrobiales bacterium]
MDFTFLHAADLHLGSPLTGLAMKDEDVARRFAAASREAFSELVARALTEKVAFVLIAGDVYDGDWKDTSIGLFFNREVARLARAEIPVYFIRGNHDAESEITKAVLLPDSVMEFSTRKAETKRIEALKVAIHGRSFPDRAASDNYALTYPAAVPGWFNIGMLHTSLEGNAAHAVYAPCSMGDLVSRGYDYWALGHVHDYAVLNENPWVVYSGNLQGRSVRECGPKGAVLVDVRDGSIAGLRPLIVDKARWLHETVDISGLDDERLLDDMLRESLRLPLAQSEGRLSAVRVTLTGTTPLHGTIKAQLASRRDDLQALMNHLHEDAWLESLKITTREPHAARIEASGGLDPQALLAGLESDDEIRAQARDMIALVKSKMPAAFSEDGLDDLDSLLADARALATARALNGTGH